MIRSFHLQKSVLCSVFNTSHPQLDQVLPKLWTHLDACLIVVFQVHGNMELVSGFWSSTVDGIKILCHRWITPTSTFAPVFTIWTVLNRCSVNQQSLMLHFQFVQRLLNLRESKQEKKNISTSNSYQTLLVKNLSKLLKPKKFLILLN